MGNNDNLFLSPEYKKSRKAYTLQAMFEYFSYLMLTDAFLATLLDHAGVSDWLIGIISSFLPLSFLFQMLSVFIVKGMKNTKRTVIIWAIAGQIIPSLSYLVPFLPLDRGVKVIMIVSFLIVGQILQAVISNVCFGWGNSFVDPEKRGRYNATKEIVSRLGGIVFSLIAGYAFDMFTQRGNAAGGFVFIAIALLLVNLCNFVCFMNMSNEKKDEKKQEASFSLKEVLKNTLGHKPFRNVVILAVMWEVARYSSVGFMGTYKTKELMFSVGFIQVINMAASFACLLLTRPFGKFTDKTSFATAIEVAFVMTAVSYGFSIFAAPASRWCIIVYTILFQASMAGVNANMLNIAYSYVDKKYVVVAMAVKNSIGGVCGFCASLVASSILKCIQENGNRIFGIQIYAQQFLSVISFVMLIAAVLFIKFVISKQEVKKQ